MSGPAPRPVAERFWEKVDKSGDCWMWTKGTQAGYGVFRVGNRKASKVVRAHRFAWETIHGPLPEGLVLDHECHNGTTCEGGDLCPHRRCVNPDHLTPKTRRENTNASHLAHVARTHCPNGHEYTPENTYCPPGRRERQCRTCIDARNKARYMKHRERSGEA